MPNAKIDFYVNGVYVGTGTTDDNGVVTILHTFKSEGTHTITGKFSGNDSHIESSAISQINVSKIPTITSIVRDGDNVIVTLTDVNGITLADKEITVKIGDKTFTGRTNQNGEFIISYKNHGRYSISAVFGGDDAYYSSRANNNPVRSGNPVINETPVDNDKPVDSENSENPNDNSATNVVAMENTGLPITAILLILLTTLGALVIGRKR